MFGDREWMRQRLEQLTFEIECRQDAQDIGEGPPVRPELYAEKRQLERQLGLATA